MPYVSFVNSANFDLELPIYLSESTGLTTTEKLASWTTKLCNSCRKRTSTWIWQEAGYMWYIS